MAVWLANARAEVPVATPAANAASAPLSVSQTHPPVDARMELKGAELLKALRAGGFVLYLRHTETGEVTPECRQSNLSKTGEDQARAIGVALRELRIPIGDRESSELCRVRDTARLLDVGDFRTNEDLNNIPKNASHDFNSARMRRIAVPPRTGTNTILASHIHGGNTPDQRLLLDLGEMIVFRPDGKGGSEPVARIPRTGWTTLRDLP